MRDANIDNRVRNLSIISILKDSFDLIVAKYQDNISECWREGIETYLNAEASLQQKPGSKKELTYDFALARLLESNKHIDETAAKILLERGLICGDDGKLQYSRDITLVTGVC